MRDRSTEVARTAGRQRGLITREQLLVAGVSRSAISRWTASGRLHRVHRSVYAVGHLGLTPEARSLAAVLAAGPGAVLSHRSAAWLLRLVRRVPPAPEVTVPSEHAVRVPGVHVHRSRTLGPRDVSTLDGIPVTTVPRTLVDLAGGLGLEDLSRLCHEAHVRHGTAPGTVLVAAGRAPRTPGAARLRQALLGDGLLLGELERGFVALLRRAGLPLPRTNVRTEAGLVDCRWPDRSLVVELDSFRFHATRRQWEADVRRSRTSLLGGQVTLRYTWGDVFERPANLLRELTPLLDPAARGVLLPPGGS